MESKEGLNEEAESKRQETNTQMLYKAQETNTQMLYEALLQGFSSFGPHNLWEVSITQSGV